MESARVRIQATEVMTTSDPNGRFVLPWPSVSGPVTVTAWAPGYYVGWVKATRGGGDATITLTPYYTTDNIDYTWFTHEGGVGSASCSHCMPSFVEWLRDAHSRSALNGRFLTMYNGTDLDGHTSPLTRFADHPELGRLPLPPDPALPYFGPGFKLDFPNEAGNCATCHLPVAAASRQGPFVDPNQAQGVARDGVACELCHKVGAVVLDPSTHLPHPDRPGVLSMRLFRPTEGQQLFFGQFDDVTKRDSYLPLIEQSEFCAPCHVGVFNGVTVYNSYGEWLASPYSDPKTGQTCQACHMPPAGYDYIVYPERGGLRRDPKLVLSHHMPGAGSVELLRNAVSMSVTTQVSDGRVRVTVEIVNDKTGHHVPTDSPLRHMILLVAAADQRGQRLRQIEGPTVPKWCGVGDPTAGNYADLPGKAFAKVLEELGTGEAPTGAYWNRTRVLSDNRLAAFARDVSTYAFVLPANSGAAIEVKLVFRRAFKALATLKSWPSEDIVMAEQCVEIKP